MAAAPAPARTEVHTLPNGVRLLLLPEPRMATAAVSVFVASGSQHEGRLDNGIGHVVEHMVFKGTARRSAERINLDAEQLGAEVNAHTDKDHTAFHLHGLAADAGRFVAMLGELVCEPRFPADELERERQVLLQEFSEDEDDPMAAAYRLFDQACYGRHPLAQPAIGLRANVERFTREQLVAWTVRQFTGVNTVVAAIGPLDGDALRRDAEAAFGALPRGTPHTVPAPQWQGGLRSKKVDAGSQAHLVLGFAAAPRGRGDAAAELAAALLGEGMSAPLMAELRERRGLVYYAACAADALAASGELVIEASFAPKRMNEVLDALPPLLRRAAEHVDPVHANRARAQLRVKRLRAFERAGRRIEDAALDLLALGRVREAGERLAEIDAVGDAALRGALQAMLAGGAAAGLAGSLPRAAGQVARERLAPVLGADA